MRHNGQYNAMITEHSLRVGHTVAGAWAGGTQYGVNLVLLIKILCLVLCVTSI